MGEKVLYVDHVSHGLFSKLLDLFFAGLKPPLKPTGFIGTQSIGPRGFIRLLFDSSRTEKFFDYENNVTRWSMFTAHRVGTDQIQWKDASFAQGIGFFMFMIGAMVSLIAMVAAAADVTSIASIAAIISAVLCFGALVYVSISKTYERFSK